MSVSEATILFAVSREATSIALGIYIAHFFLLTVSIWLSGLKTRRVWGLIHTAGHVWKYRANFSSDATFIYSAVSGVWWMKIKVVSGASCLHTCMTCALSSPREGIWSVEYDVDIRTLTVYVYLSF